MDPVWLNISSNIYMPFNATGNFHPEYVGYEYGQVVKQVLTSLFYVIFFMKCNNTI